MFIERLAVFINCSKHKDCLNVTMMTDLKQRGVSKNTVTVMALLKHSKLIKRVNVTAMADLKQWGVNKSLECYMYA